MSTSPPARISLIQTGGKTLELIASRKPVPLRAFRAKLGKESKWAGGGISNAEDTADELRKCDADKGGWGKKNAKIMRTSNVRGPQGQLRRQTINGS